MKIRPTDSSPPSPGPEEVQGKKKAEFSGVEDSPPETGAVESTKKAAFSELQGIQGKEQLATRFVDLALKDFESSVGPGDLGRVQTILQEQLESDPFLQGKLERISGLLSKK